MSSAAVGGTAGAMGAQTAIHSTSRARLRRFGGESMSIWMVNQDGDHMLLAIGIRTKKHKLQAQDLGSGEWQIVGKFSDADTCTRVFQDLQKQVNAGAQTPIRIPKG